MALCLWRGQGGYCYDTNTMPLWPYVCGEGRAVTPRMDALAASGVVLSRAYTYRYCSPTRSALLSGQQPPFRGVKGTKALLHPLLSGQHPLCRGLKGTKTLLHPLGSGLWPAKLTL